MTCLGKCTKCGEVKPSSQFYKDKHRKSGITAHCKSCRKIYRDANPFNYDREYFRNYYLNKTYFKTQNNAN